MFIDTLEFTIPIDLCSLYATLQQEPRSQLEFPASVNSYGTTQDASVQVVLRANKVTFKVDGVSSNASIISKSECKTLKLSIFDVDRSLMQKNVTQNNSNNVSAQQASPVSHPSKRLHEQSVSCPPSKSSRTSYNNDSPRPRSPFHRRSQSHRPRSPHSLENAQAKSYSDTPVDVKQEPEDPDLIEIIEPDPEPDDIVPKKETPFMQIDYSSDVPHTQTSQAALDRLSHPPTSCSQSQSSPFHQNVPHVPDYSEPGPSQLQGHHGDQSADDFLVFQDDNDYGDDNEEADYSNDGQEVLRDDVSGNSTGGHYFEQQDGPISVPVPGNSPASSSRFQPCGDITGPTDLDHFSSQFYRVVHPPETTYSIQRGGTSKSSSGSLSCEMCGKEFPDGWRLRRHKQAAHENIVYPCACGKIYKYKGDLTKHQKQCTTAGYSS